MTTKKQQLEIDTTTEEKMKNAARAVFHRKGFAATRTRDIATEAGMNVALLNYYFRSKENLFRIIMLETMMGFMQSMIIIFNDESITLEEKIESVAAKYIDFIIKEPEIPLFILSEVRRDAGDFLDKLPIGEVLANSSFIKQYNHAVQQGMIREPNFMHFLMNLMGMVIFPFMASPLMKKIGSMKDAQFHAMMQERKRLIPVWIKAMMNAQ
jgi:AcrR family transcriptional regulator